MTDSMLAGHGLQIPLPRRWEGRLYLRTRQTDGAHAAAYGHPDESFHPVVHLATFPLPPGRGDFGTGAVEVMGPEDAFVALLEYDSAEACRPLFAARGMPRLMAREFAGNALQRRLPGQLGCQRFCTTQGRPFCVYAVLGSRRAAFLLGEINAVLASATVTSR